MLYNLRLVIQLFITVGENALLSQYFEDDANTEIGK